MFPSCFNLLNQPKEPQSFQLEKETVDHAKKVFVFLVLIVSKTGGNSTVVGMFILHDIPKQDRGKKPL